MPKNKLVIKLKGLIVEEAAETELQILGILGKMLSGPWMNKFYTNLKECKNPIDTMAMVKNVIEELKKKMEDSKAILLAEKDFFGDVLPAAAKEIMVAPTNRQLFQDMMTACLKGTVSVLERQYRQSFLTVETTTESVLSSVRQHTMEVESVIGEYCERKKVSPNAYVSSIGHIIKAKRNDVWNYVNGLEDTTFQQYLDVAMRYSTRMRMGRKTEKEILEAEIKKRNKKKTKPTTKQEKATTPKTDETSR